MKLAKLIEELIEEYSLKEYFIRSGDKVDALLVLNIFGDMLESPIEDHMDGDVSKVIKKYRPIAKKLERVIKKYKKHPIPEHLASDADDRMYDGSDAYDSAEDYNYDIPGIYDDQIEFVHQVINELK